MNSKIIIWIAMLFLIVAFLLEWRFDGKNLIKETQPSSKSSLVLKKNTDQNVVKENVKAEGGLKFYEINKIKEGNINDLLQSPFVINGKVEDQYGNPVPLATVEAGIIGPHASVYGGSNLIITKTNEKGIFSVSTIGFSGSVAAKKQGYLATKESRVQTSPGGSNILLRIKKIELTAIQIHNTFQLALDRSGKIQETDVLDKSGDTSKKLEFQCWIDVKGSIPNNLAEYRWKVKIIAQNGGILLNFDKGNGKAPENGYEKVIFISSSDLKKWSDRIEVMAFIKFSDQKYAKVFMHFFVGKNPLIMGDVYCNSIGSRDLDFDPADLEGL